MDGTKQFIERSFDDVTILIGVSYKTKPVAGVIARPFTRHANGEPFVIWAVNRGAESAVKSNFGGFASLGEVTPPPRPTRTAVISFRAAASERYSAFLARARLTKTLKMGGCGRKVFALINGEADVYPFPVRGTKKWDTCAPQAILEALGGKFTMPDGAEFVYAENGVDNKEGFVATLGVDHCSFIEID